MELSAENATLSQQLSEYTRLEQLASAIRPEMATLFPLVMLGGLGESYDSIVQNVTRANVYNIHFKEDMDSVMYMMVAHSISSTEALRAASSSAWGCSLPSCSNWSK